MLNLILPLALALVGGAGGFFLRRWELASGFDTNGLPILWSAPSLILIALSVALAVAFILLLRKPKYQPGNYNEAFSAQNNWPYLAVMALSAAAILFAGIFGLRYNGYCSILCKLTNLLCLLSFVCILATAWSSFRGQSMRFSLTLLVPGYTLCLWLVSAYQKQAADPVVLNFVYEMLAIICTLLGLYFSVGFSFERAKFRRCTMFSLLGIFFTLVTLADPHNMGDRLMLLFMFLYQLAHLIPLLYHGFVAYKPTPTPAPSNETNDIQEVTPDE